MCRILPPTPQLVLMPTSATETALSLPRLDLFHPLSNMPRKMKERQTSCRNSAASQRRSCAVGCCTTPLRTGRPLYPLEEHVRRRGLSLRAVQEEETPMLAIRVALVLPPHQLMAGSAAQVCMDTIVLSDPCSANF